MKHGDLSNAEAGRLWFVAEGLVLLPEKCKRTYKTVRHTFVLNTWVYKRMWDLVWRQDFRLAIVTFNTRESWVESVEELVDDFDLPAPVHAYELDAFRDSIVTLPSCLRIFDPDPARALSYGAKGVYVDPAYDWEPLA